MRTILNFVPATVLIGFTFATLPPAQAQTLAKNGQWLENQFAQLINDKKDSEAPKFSFKGCQMTMDLDAKGGIRGYASGLAAE